MQKKTVLRAAQDLEKTFLHDQSSPQGSEEKKFLGESSASSAALANTRTGETSRVVLEPAEQLEENLVAVEKNKKKSWILIDGHLHRSK